MDNLEIDLDQKEKTVKNVENLASAQKTNESISELYVDQKGIKKVKYDNLMQKMD